jgi:AcrR family transcriptional regulator
VTRERRILDAAAELFHEKGFHVASVDELGTAAGLSGPALYRHFAGKNEILAALFNLAMDELLGAAQAADEPDAVQDPQRALERLIRHHVSFTLGHRHLVSVYQREARSLVDPWRSSFAARRKEYVDRWDGLLGRCFPEAGPLEIAVAAQSCLGMIFSITFWPGGLLRRGGVDHLVVRLAQASLDSLEQRSASSSLPVR